MSQLDSGSSAANEDSYKPTLTGRIHALRNILTSPKLAQLSPVNCKLFLERIAFQRQLNDLANTIKHDWRQHLDERRDHNPQGSAANHDALEQTLFTEIYHLARQYQAVRELQDTYARLLGREASAAQPYGALRDWLEALADAPQEPPLPPDVSEHELHAERRKLADEWLAQMSAQSDRARLQHAVRIIGTESQRRRAQQPPRRMPIAFVPIAAVLVALLLLAVGSQFLPLNTSASGTTTTNSSVIVPTNTPAPPQIREIQPNRISLTQQGQTIALIGSNLDQIDASAINLIMQIEGSQALTFTIQDQSAERMLLSLAQFELNREQVLVDVQLYGQVAAGFTLISGAPEYDVAGVRAEYAYTGKIDPSGNASLLNEPNGTFAVGTLQNDDRVRVLDGAVDGWFQVLVLAGNSQGQVGWIERWLVLNAEVPPPPPTATPTATATATPTATPTATFTPQPPTASPTAAASPTFTPLPTFTASPLDPTKRVFSAALVNVYIDAEQPDGCVQGLVLNRNNGGVAGAIGNVNNGNDSLEWRSDGNGFYEVCGLGGGNWNVVLDFIPDPQNRSQSVLAAQTRRLITLSGQPGEIVVVHFSEQ